MKSPWNKDSGDDSGEPTHEQKLEELAEALQSAESSDDAVAAEAVEDDEDSDEEQDSDEKSELFDEPEADASSDDDEEVADPDAIDPDEKLFDDPEDDEPQIPKGWTKGTYKRLGKVIAQRNEAREQIKALEADRDRAKSLAGVLHEKYAEFTDPVAQATRDIQFMEALEQLATANPDVNAFAERIVDFIKTGRFNVPDATNPTPAARITESKPEPQRDERVDRIVRRDAEREVSSTLAALNVKPSFQKIIGDSILGDSSLDLTTVDRKLVIERAKSFIKENGFSADEVLAKAKAESKAADKPATGGGRAPTSPSRKRTQARASDEQSGDGGSPKNIDEWEQRHEERMRSFGQ